MTASSVSPTRPAPIPPLTGADTPVEWEGMQLATLDARRHGYNSPAYANNAGMGDIFRKSGNSIGEAVAKATALAGDWRRIGEKENMKGPAAVAVLQAKDGTFYSAYLSDRPRESWWPYKFDDLKSAVRHTDALKAIVGASFWIKFDGPAVAPEASAEPKPISDQS